MKPRLSLQVQFFLAILIGLGVGYLLSDTAPFGSTVVQQMATASATVPPPFVDLNDVLLVKILFSEASPPQVTEVKELQRGRLTVGAEGESRVAILDAGSQELYSVVFHVDFTISGLGKKRETMERTFVLPLLPGGVSLTVRTPQGEMKYDLQPTQ